MELGKKYKRNNKKFGLELLVPSERRLIKRKVYESFQFNRKTKFNNDFFYVVPLGNEFFYFPVETSNDELIWVFKCEKITSVKIEKFKKTESGKYRAEIHLNNKIYYSQELEADGDDKLKSLTEKIKSLKTSELFLQSFFWFILIVYICTLTLFNVTVSTNEVLYFYVSDHRSKERFFEKILIK